MAFFMDKALFVIITMYSLSFSMLGAQYIIGDVLGIQLTDFNNQPLKSGILNSINQGSFNSIQNNVTSTARSSLVTNIVTAAQIGFEIFQLITGTFIFNIILMFGVPLIFVYGLTGIYFILLAMFIIGHIKDFI